MDRNESLRVMPHFYSRFFRAVRGVSIVCLMIALMPLSSSGQSKTPEFDADVVSLRSSTRSVSSRLDLYTKIPYANLSFESSVEGFVADYRVSAEVVEIRDDGTRGNPIESPVWDRRVRATNHAETNSQDRFDLTTHSLSVVPGRYAVELTLENASTGESFVKETTVLVRDFSAVVSISDLLLLEDYDQETRTVTPSVSNRLSAGQLGFSLMYEVYVRQPQSVRIRREVYQVPGADGEATRTGGIEALGEPIHTDDERKFLEASRSQHIVTVPINDMKLGKYLVRAVVESESGDMLDYSEKEFSVNWLGLASHINDVDDAIAQLQYIAKTREIRHMREPDSKSERLARFREFWRRRDPTPGTARNERMEEYYYRVDHANKRYGSLMEGWKTDRGQVVVLFGEPDYVERHPYNFNVEPYEVWYFYRIGRRFIFVDRTGLGDYQLLVPIWDERTRIR